MSLRREFEKWKKDNQQSGTLAWARFAMFDFILCTNQVSKEFILKGGHLLWKRIRIQRGTTDLDYAMREARSDIAEDLRAACSQSSKFEFVMESLKKGTINTRAGFTAVICFREKERSQEDKRYTPEGRLIGYSKFTIDIGFDPDVDSEEMMIDGEPIHVASIVNIFLDKLDACTRRGSENTRIKDFDDLVRIIRSDEKVDRKHLVRLAGLRGIPLKVDTDIADPGFRKVWSRYHEIEYRGGSEVFPEEPLQAIEIINEYLSETER